MIWSRKDQLFVCLTILHDEISYIWNCFASLLVQRELRITEWCLINICPSLRTQTQERSPSGQRSTVTAGSPLPGWSHTRWPGLHRLIGHCNHVTWCQVWSTAQSSDIKMRGYLEVRSTLPAKVNGGSLKVALLHKRDFALISDTMWRVTSVTCTQGSWPAIWMLGSGNGHEWPRHGEIDIVEAVNGDPRVDWGNTINFIIPPIR